MNQQKINPRLQNVAMGKMEYFEVTFEITETGKAEFFNDPESFAKKFYESHGQVVNGVILAPEFINEVKDIIKMSHKGDSVHARHVIAHIDAPKKYKSWHVSVRSFIALPPINENVTFGKIIPGLRKFAEGDMEIFEVAFEISAQNKASALNNPALFVRKYMESHGETVNDVLLPASFYNEMREAIISSKKGESTILRMRPICHLGSPWFCWSRFIILKK